MQMAISIYAQFINIFLLVHQNNVEMCIIHFVALEVILEFMALYLESLKDHQLQEIMEEHPRIKIRGKDIKTRTPFHKVARAFYKLIRALYVSIFFYFIPYGVFYVLFIFSTAGEGGGHGGGGGGGGGGH